MARKSRILVVDSRHRVTLGARLAGVGEEFTPSVDDRGVITLYPVMTVNAYELEPGETGPDED